MKKKIYLLGNHSNRTPFSYSSYKGLFSDFFEYVDLAEDADILILGFVIDIEPNLEIIKFCKLKKPDLKIVVISEEPLWDTLWSGNFNDVKQSRNFNGFVLDFTFLNHHNSNIFEFEKIPYFLTTSVDFLVRYRIVFSRNSKLTVKELKKIWSNASIDAAFFAEYRDTDKYEKSFPEYDIYALSKKRTNIAKDFRANKVVRVGQGWGAEVKRQALPDWHLDKLAALDKNCKIISALENTHQKNYISEKIFDAYACLGVPIYCSSEFHAVSKFFPEKSYLNIFNNDFDLSNFDINSSSNDIFSPEIYLEVQNDLSNLFSSEAFFTEKQNVVGKICSYMDYL